MKSRITKLAAAAAVVIAAVLTGIYLFGGSFPGSSVAYGIADLPELIKKAKTIHIKGWVYFPKRQDGQEPA